MYLCPSCGHDGGVPARFCPECGAPLEARAPERETRKTVTVVFCDVTGSTELGEQLDPESLRRVMARYFETARDVIERHGGTVEKFIGDAVMAVFGVPRLHEDDALRAVRAAHDLRAALGDLNEELVRDHGVALELRIGVNTGEVVTGTEERLATGDAVNVAARLESAAAPGEVLLGETTAALVRDAVELEPPLALTLKGKAEPVLAYRLVGVIAGVLGHTRHLEGTLVGRKRELQMLAGVWDRVRSEGACHLFTVLGPPGVGKTRLTAEFLAGVGDARVLRAQCLSYGEGITYWPVVELLLQLLGDEPHAALETLGVEGPAAAAAAGLLGKGEVASSVEETAWGIRKVLEAAAAAEPLVILLEDIHWGEPAFLDLVEHVADWSRASPILLLCLARPDLLDRRQGWGGGKVNASTVLLEALSVPETDELIAHLLDGVALDAGVRARISDAAGGNPLFVEEMVAMLREGNDGEVVVPPTIQALLAARLDQLDPAERAVLACGSVEGQLFHVGAVQALAPEEQAVPSRLMALVRKELLRPDTAQLPGDDAFRFRHMLIRDAAYDALSKSTRADLHEHFALWLEERETDLIEADEIVGYHLEQAFRYRSELGPVGDADRALAARASSRLAAAGEAAEGRGDSTGAANLLGRALMLLPADEPAIDLRLGFAETLHAMGRLTDAHQAAVRAAELAVTTGDRAGELRARLCALQTLLYSDPEGRTDELKQLLDEALPVFERLGDDRGLLLAWKAAESVGLMQLRWDEVAAACEHAIACSRRLGNRREEEMQLLPQGRALVHGRTPVVDVERWCDEQGLLVGSNPFVMLMRALCLGYTGRVEEARDLCTAARALLRESGRALDAAGTGQLGWQIERLARDEVAAEEVARRACEELEQLGEQGALSTLCAYCALSLTELNRDEEAEEWARRGLELGGTDDILTLVVGNRALAGVALHRGDLGEAERCARNAVSLIEPTEAVNDQAEALLDLAAVLRASGDAPGARAFVERAVVLFEAKGILVSEKRARTLLAELRG